MPLFVDHHRGHTISADEAKAMVTDGPFGVGIGRDVRALGHWAGYGAVYCLLEAPDAAAVSRYHAQQHQAGCDVRPIEVRFHAEREWLTGQQRLLVSDFIRELW
jgi:hypothetical protein